MLQQEIVLELVRAGVRPEGKPGESGIYLSGGGTGPFVVEPFVVERGWSGVAGYYNEQWSIRRGGTEVLYTSESRQLFVRGVQSVTSYTDTVLDRIRLDPGEYNLVFLVEGMYLGHVDFVATGAGEAGGAAV